jgi:AsmA-like C-terminal region
MLAAARANPPRLGNSGPHPGVYRAGPFANGRQIMTVRKKRWIIGIAAGLAVTIVALYIAAIQIAKGFEPMIRQQAIRYLEDRFHTDVQLSAIHIHMPKMSAYRVIRRGRGALVSVDAEGLSMRMRGAAGEPPLFTIHKVTFVLDLGVLREPHKTVEGVMIDGMQINLPPKGHGPKWTGGSDQGGGSNVVIQQVRIRNALLTILPEDKTKRPLKFNIATLHLTSVGVNRPMKYEAVLSIPKPPGEVKSTGNFGPWETDEPGDTRLAGAYTFNHADLGIFNGIAGILDSKGTFTGSLAAVNAKGEADVPDFRLKMAGNPVPLSVQFEALVDGTNGDTVLRPVKAKLGSTYFTTTGAVIKRENGAPRAINLKVTMPNGNLQDLLRLAMKGSPFMDGRIQLNTRIGIPPLTGPVKQKLDLDGKFQLSDARFLRSNIQNEIDKLSRRGQGQPSNENIDDVATNMRGSFRLDNEVMTFRSLTFAVPGADVDIAGNYNLKADTLDFHGALKLVAKISDTMTGWKHWLLKPVDPFFSKNGAGTFLHIKIDGSARHPNFGLDHGHDDQTADLH